MSTEVWFRNPKNYARELAEVGHPLIAWDRGVLIKMEIDPNKHASLFFAPNWRALIVGGQGTMELDADHDATHPKAVYPTWSYGQPSALLEEMLANPVGNNSTACFDLECPPDERPVWGQEHKVVIAEGPPGGAITSLGRRFYGWIAELQEEFPDATIHLHGSYTFRVMFGLGLKSVDFDPRTSAGRGEVYVPNGSIVKYQEAQKHPKWLHAMGMSVKDIEVPRNRSIYNIRSALWAAENYSKLFNFRTKKSNSPVDTETPTADFTPEETINYLTTSKKALPGDKITCNTCSLRPECKYEREGAVCSVPGTEHSNLAKFFKTRDAQSVIDGLQQIMALQAQRIEQGMEEENVTGLDPEVTKMLKALFDQGVQIAKLLDPALRSGPKVNVNVNGGGGTTEISVGSPKNLIAKVMRELEQSGIPREKITTEMVEGVLAGMVDQASQNKAIQGTVLGYEDK